ncbi:MAG: twin-arginine translocase TatA/TatE family subunit [Chloroflexi bacterium]|nr:twin-arginine translocase TatA/TatE family subunit [Chloroflexota bacterium]
MNFLGMGTMEIVVVLLVAFLFLGPERMIGVAKTLGKTMAELRRMTEDLPKLVLDEDENAKPPEAPIVHRGSGPNPTINNNSDTSQISPYSPPATTTEEVPASEDGPVPFQRPAPIPDNPEPMSKQESE